MSLLGVQAAWFGGCAFPSGNSQQSYVMSCILPADQSATLSGHWATLAVPVSFHQGDFSATEMSAGTAAANSWNDFSTVTHQKNAIDYGGDAANPRLATAAKPSALCAQGMVSGKQYTGSIVIYKQAQWPYSNLPDAIALTSYCSTPSSSGGLAIFYMAIMEVNYQNFFLTGGKIPDLQTIFLHEFGHVMGLAHSCGSTTQAGFPNCSSPTIASAYVDAVMYPVFSFDQYGAGQQKRMLATDDQQRANCLY